MSEQCVRGAITPEGPDLIVDCDACGEVGRVPAIYHPSKPGPDEMGRVDALFEQHLNHARDHAPDPGPGRDETTEGNG